MSLFKSMQNPPPAPPQSPGTVGILTTEQGRFSRFWTSMLSLEVPPGTKLIVKMSLNIAEARNEVLNEASGDWVWFIDDDHTFEPKLLKNLLARNVPVIQPLVLTRYSPFGPVIMGPAAKDAEGTFWRYGLDDAQTTGLKKVSIVGAAGMLVRRSAWEQVAAPRFAFGGQVVAEDVNFCRKLGEAGVPIYCDLDNRMGHLNVGEVWPELQDGKWVTRVRFGHEEIRIPKAQAKYLVDNDGNIRAKIGEETS